MVAKSGLQYFWLRRMHSLLGVLPIGGFVLEHFYSNSFAFHGADAYNKMVVDLQHIPILVFLEVGLILLPIFLHIALGFVIIATGANNFLRYSNYTNWMYFFQRVTGVIAAVYIVYHVWSTRISSALAGKIITFDDMRGLLAPGWAKWFYAIGITSICFHFANGIATSLITWGITSSPRAQRVASKLSWGVFAVMSVWGLLILKVFA